MDTASETIITMLGFAFLAVNEVRAVLEIWNLTSHGCLFPGIIPAVIIDGIKSVINKLTFSIHIC